jgi:putative transposase
VIEPLLKMPKRTKDKVKEHVDEVRSCLPVLLADMPEEERRRYTVSVSSVYRWIRDYEQGNCDLRALIDALIGRSGAPGKSRLQGRVDEIIEEKIEEIYLKERVRVTVQEVLEAVAAQINEENKLLAEDKKMRVPVYNTIISRTNQLDPKELYQLRYGPEASRQRLRQFNKMEPVELPLQRTEIDHTLLDLIVLDLDAIPLGRLTFTHCLDAATRHPLGYYLGFEPPSYLTVMECLKHTIMPKNTRERYHTENEWLAYGIPVSLAVDNGREFRGYGLEDACQLLGIILEPNKARSP